MSKGAVQGYGVEHLEGMNAAAGGTNIPTLKRLRFLTMRVVISYRLWNG